jgi:hypothetical protein
MNETTETEVVELEAEEVTEEATAEPSEIELQAAEHGWSAEGIEGKRNLTAEEFMDRQPLYDDIRSLKKQTRKLQDGIEAMKEMQSGIRQREREKTITELNGQKKAALQDENYDAVIAIDDQIAQERATEQEPVNNVAFEQWVDNNEWYHQDTDMKQYADMIGAGFANMNPTKAVSEVYSYVAEETKKRFPDKFGNVNREKPNPVEGAGKGRQAGGGAKHRASELSDADRQIMKTIVRAGAMSEQDYLKEFFA